MNHFVVLRSMNKILKDYFSGIVDNCRKVFSIWSYSAPYSVQIRENADQNNSKYGHFSCSGLPKYN